jgi:hypothetical protein
MNTHPLGVAAAMIATLRLAQAGVTQCRKFLAIPLDTGYALRKTTHCVKHFTNVK